MSSWFTPIALLLGSNIFMTFAWYGHLKFTGVPLWKAVVVSWAIAFFEYCLMVPANRWGVTSGYYSPVQLKIIQEAITLVVFCLFAISYLGERLRWNHYGALLLVFTAVILANLPTEREKRSETNPTVGELGPKSD